VDHLVLQRVPLVVELLGGGADPGLDRQRDDDAHLQQRVGDGRRHLPTGGLKDGSPGDDKQSQADDHEKDGTGAIHFTSVGSRQPGSRQTHPVLTLEVVGMR
jgi:hypothetical protein